MRKIDANAELSDFLRRYNLEGIIPDKALPHVELRQYSAGEFLCHAGDPADYLWLIVEGRCKVIPASEDGKTVVLSYLDPVGLNGDIELFNNCAFLHSVQADDRVTAITIPSATFFSDMMQCLPFLQLLCRRFASKIYQSSQKHSSAMLYHIKNRLARYIVKLVEISNNPVITLRTEEAAQYLGITARHLRRVLGDFESEGLLHRTGTKITIDDMSKILDRASYY